MNISIEEAKELYQAGFKDIAKRAYPNFDFERDYTTITNLGDFFRYFGYSNECARMSDVLAVGKYSKSAEGYMKCCLAYKAIICGDDIYNANKLYKPFLYISDNSDLDKNTIIGKVVVDDCQFSIRYAIKEDVNDGIDLLFSFTDKEKCKHFIKYFGKDLFNSKFADIKEYKWV